MRVLTFKLLSPDQADWPRRRAVIAEGLERLEPDVVAFQEIADDDLLGPGWSVVAHSQRSENGVGAVLASRWPVGEAREVDLHVTLRTESFPWCAAVIAEIEAPVGPLLFVHHKPTWHLGYAHERELQAVTTAPAVEETLRGRDMHVVLAGDFDDTPDSSSIRFWTGRQSLDGFSVRYEDAWEAVHGDAAGHTFTPRNPLVTAGEMSLERGRRIDYVMTRCGVHGPTLDVAACELAFAEPVDGVWASDHFGVVADLEVP
jgi:endonuclease/exonuclease/phosphatase family metal-dependent hydrolase